MVVPDPLGGLGAVTVRQSEVHQDDLGPQGLGGFDGFLD